jgi:WD40 repeat protein
MPPLSVRPRGKPRLERLWRAVLPDHVIALAWSPGGRHLAAAAASGPVAVSDAGGQIRHTLAGHAFGSTAVAWADDDTVVSAGQDGRVRLWDAVGGGQRLALDGGAAWVEGVAAGPGGAYLATAAGRKLRLWDRQGRLVRD